MKKVFLLLVMTIAILPAVAQIQGVDKAKTVAERFFSQKNDGMVQPTVVQGDSTKVKPVRKAKRADGLVLAHEVKDADKSLLYVFTDRKQKEFAIVTADEQAPTIIAYSTKQAFDEDNIIPPVKAFMDAYTRMLKDGKSIKKVAANADRHSIWPLIETQWSQDFPYNMMVPDGCLVGCVPLAMGQMMKYYEYPKQGKGSHGGINFAEQQYDYSRMICAHSSESNSDEVGKLLYHAGVACDAVYGYDATGSLVDNAVEAMKTYFSFNTSATLTYRSDMEDAAWDEKVYAELAAGHPLIYSGFPEGSAGHTFIVDGYHDDYYHVNWGWGGYQDGYFLLSALKDYQYAQSAVFGLAPDGWTPGQKEANNYKTFGFCDNTIASIFNYAYWDDESYHEKGISSGFPMSHLAPYEGATIIGVQIGLAEDVTGMRVFLNEGYQWSTPAWAGYSEPYYTQEVGDCHQGWNTIMFDTPQTVDRGFNVAYEYDMRPYNSAVACSPSTYPSQLYVRDELGSEFPSYDGGQGHWIVLRSIPCIRLIFADDTEMPYDVRVPYMEEVTVVDNSHIRLKGVMENLSGCDIKQVTMKYVIDTKPEKTITLNLPIDYQGKAYFTLNIEEELTPGEHRISVWPVEVDGYPDALMHNSDVYKTSPLTFYIKGESSIPRTHVIDALTDTYCPVSNWYLSLQEEYEASNPGKAIFINTHVRLMGPDPMDNVINPIFNIDDWLATPTVFFNGFNKNSYSEIDYQLSTFDQVSPAAIDGSASFSADKKKVIVKTDANFAYNHDAEYHYEYVLVEENVGPFKELGDGLYKHVARAKYTTNQEVFTYPIEAGKTYQNYYSFEIPDNVQNINNIHVVAIVVDDHSGEFMNGVDLQIGDYQTDVFALDKSQLSMMTDLTAKLNVVENAKTASGDQHVWTSSDESVVKVMDDGFVQTTGPGTAVITCTSASSGATAQCQVNVTAWPNEVTVTTPGTLHELVGVSQYTSLKINGSLNEYDFEYIRALTGGQDQYYPENSSGTVTSLNLKDAEVHYEGTTIDYWTQDDMLPNSFGGNLRHLVCPTSIKSICQEAICTGSLRSLTLFEGLENIQPVVCEDTPLNHIYFPSTVNTLYLAFRTSDIEHIGIAKNSPFRVHDNCIYTKDGRLVQISAKYKRKFVLPDWCTETDDVILRLERRITEIVALQFTSVTVDFSSCRLRKYVLGPKLKQAGSMFREAYDLTEVVMPPLTPPVLTDFDNSNDWNPANCTLYVNPKSIELYKAHSLWSKFFIQPMTDEMLAEMEPYYQELANQPDYAMLTDETMRIDIDKGEQYSADDYVWTSSDESVAKVMDDGYVLATGAGEAVITRTLTSTNEPDTFRIAVTAWPDEVTVTTPGTLSSLVEIAEFNTLKINGELNENDLQYISDMTGIRGILTRLSLKDATIINSTDRSQDNVLTGFLVDTKVQMLICPSSLKSIAYKALAWSGLKSVTLNEGLVSLGEKVFAVTELKHVYLPSTLTSLNCSLSDSNIEHCAIADGNKKYFVYDNWIYSKDKRLCQCINIKDGILELPDWCVSFEPYLVSDDGYITQFIGRGIRSLERGSVGFSCKKMKVGPYLEHVDNAAFFYMGKMTEIIMPPLTPPTLDELWCEYMDPANCTLYVNPKSIERYKAHSEWSKFNIQPMTDEMLAEMEPLYTGITDVKTDATESDNVYDISGRRIHGNIPRNTILIRDNKKFIIR